MTRFCRPADHSALGVRSRTDYLSRAHSASLDVTDGDFLLLYHLIIASSRVNFIFILWEKEGGAPMRGVRVRIIPNYLQVTMHNLAGAPVVFQSAAGTIPLREFILTIWGDRDGNIQAFVDDTEILSVPMVAVNPNQSNIGGAYLTYFFLPGYYVTPNLLGNQFWNFGIDGIPSVTQRQQIINEMLANPWIIPPTLSARSNANVECGLVLDFMDEDPDSLLIHDKSPGGYNNDYRFGLGSRWRDVGKEFYNV